MNARWLTLMLLIGSATLGCAPAPPSPSSTRWTDRVREIADAQRPYPLRLTGFDAYIDCADDPFAQPDAPAQAREEPRDPIAQLDALARPCRGDTATDRATARDDDALAALKGALRDAESADAWHARGLLHLVFEHDSDRGPDRDAIAHALDALRAAYERPIADNAARGSLLNDLGVAHTLRAAQGHAADLFEALIRFDEAAALRPNDDAIRFNQALILQLLALEDDARAAWRAAQRLASPAWRAEIDARLAASLIPSATPLFLKVRAWSDGRSIAPTRQDAAHWAIRAPVPVLRHVLLLRLVGGTGEADVDRLLDALQDKTGDRLARAIDDHWRTVHGANGSAARAIALRRGVRRYLQGHRAYADDRFDDAARAFARADAHLAVADSPLRLWTQMDLAIGRYRAGGDRAQLAQLDTALETIGASAQAAGAPTVGVYTLWIRGFIAERTDDLDAAQRHYAAAARRAKGARLHDVTGWLHTLQLRIHAEHQESDKAMGHLLPALHHRAWHTERRRWVALPLSAFQTVQQLAGSAIARRFEQPALRAADHHGTPILQVETRVTAAMLIDEPHRYDAQTQLIRQAEKALPRIPERWLRSRAASLLALALIGRSTSLAALRDVDDAIERLAAYGDALFLPPLRIRYARILWNQRERDKAIDQQTRAARAIERSIEDIARSTSAQAAQRSARRAFGQLIDMHAPAAHVLSSGSCTQPLPSTAAQKILALDARMRRLNPVRSRALPPGVVRVPVLKLPHQLPHGTALLVYRVVRDDTAPVDRVYIGHLQRDRTPTVRVCVFDHARFTRAVKRVRDASGERAWLAQRLIGPLIDDLETAEHVVLALDGPLHALPFSILSSDRDQPLGARYALTRVLETDGLREPVVRPRDGLWDRVLAVSALQGPTTEVAENLAARAEGHDRYSASDVELLVGSEAHPQRVRAHLPDRTLVQLGAHAEADPHSGQPAAFFLRAAPGDDPTNNRLTAVTIESLDLRATQLAVLFGCATTGLHVDTFDVAGLVRPFLHAGTAAALSTLREIEDRPGAAVLEAFYEALERTDAPASALQDVWKACAQGGADCAHDTLSDFVLYEGRPRVEIESVSPSKQED
ncbi:MAG: CHAT domain-containing protein [Acidobacteriota bacterium]